MIISRFLSLVKKFKNVPVLRRGEGEALARYLAVSYAPAVAGLVREKGYGAVMAPASTFGKDFMPRLSGLLDAPLAGDIVGLAKEGGSLRVLRPMYAGK